MKMLKYIAIIFVFATFAGLQSCDTDALHELDIPKVSIDDSKESLSLSIIVLNSSCLKDY